MAQKNPLLNFSTESADIARDFILIDDEKCFMRSKQELNIKDYVNLRKMGKRIVHLYSATDITPDDLDEFSKTMLKMMQFVFIDTSEETIDKLTDSQQMEIVGAFTQLLTAGMSKGARAKMKKEEKKILAEMKGESEKKPTPQKNMNS